MLATPPPVLIGPPCTEGDTFIRSLRPNPPPVQEDRVRRFLLAAKLAGIDIHRVLKDIAP